MSDDKVSETHESETHVSKDKVYGNMETATNADSSETTTVEDAPDTVSGGAPEPTGDDHE